jgi:bifunctional DNA-binding transcriptional regulator/antitoxin component of YhaV-PrlF toxin-antitoxin module
MSWNETIATVMKGNRVTIPKEFRENFSLEPPRLLRLTLSGVEGGWKSIEFYSRLRKDGQVTIPVELFRELELQHRQAIFLHIYVDWKH